MLFSVRDVDALRLLCWCQNILPEDLNRITTETERENLMFLGLIKQHERSGSLLLTSRGRSLLHVICEGNIPNMTLSYHESAIERRLRFSRLALTAYLAGIDLFTTSPGDLVRAPTLFLTTVTRNRGKNPWGSTRVGAIAHLGDWYYAVHYVCPGIGRMAVNDELTAFHNHTNLGRDLKRAFLFAGSTYGEVIEELRVRDERRDEKLIRYGEAYRGLRCPIHLLSCDQTGALQLQIMAVPGYRAKLTQTMLKTACQPPPEDAPVWDALYHGVPFVMGADMDLRRIDAAIRLAKKRGISQIAVAALEGQGEVLLPRYGDPGLARIFVIQEAELTALLGGPPVLRVPPRTQFLTEKGDVVDAPLIQMAGKMGGPRRK